MRNKKSFIIVTDNPLEILCLYRVMLGFKPQGDINEADPESGVLDRDSERFSPSTRQIMAQATDDSIPAARINWLGRAMNSLLDHSLRRKKLSPPMPM